MKKFLLLIIFTTFSFAIDATIEVVKKFTSLATIAIEDGSGGVNSFHKSEEFYKILMGDMKVTSHFTVQKSDFYMKSDFNSEPKFDDYRANSVDLLLKYKAYTDEANTLVVDVKVYDINTNKVAYEKSYTSQNDEKFPFVAHKIAIDLNVYLKAPPIDWMEKLIVFSRYVNSKESEIVVADYTLSYQKAVVKGGLNVFPKWASGNQEEFYYTSYLRIPTLFKINIYTGKREKVTESDGMLVCSDVSRDGSKLLLTMAPTGQPDVYLFDARTGSKQKITDYIGIDVNANFLEDESRISFVSDRLGYPNIFAQKIGASGVEQLVYHGKNNNSSTAYKDYVVYSARESSSEFDTTTFNLYLISTKSDFIRRLTSIGLNQFPKFSDDGESILFIKNYRGESGLGIIRLNYNKSYLFPLKIGKLQSIDW